MNWLGEEDPELLRAALEIIEAWDVESVGVASASSIRDRDGAESIHSVTTDEHEHDAGSDDGSSDASTPATRATRAASASWNRAAAVKVEATPKGVIDTEFKPSTNLTTTRLRRKEELNYLRDKVKELGAQLETLQQQKIENGDSGEMGMTTAKCIDNALAAMWHDIASRQQRLRQKAELEHAKLKGLLETQMKVARGLIKLMQKARRIEEDESFPKVKRRKLPMDASPPTSDEAQLLRIEHSYRDMDAAFTFSKFHDGSLKFIDVQVVDDNNDEFVIELRDAWSVPFDVSQVHDALWMYFAKKTEGQDCPHPVDHQVSVYVKEDMLITTFRASAPIGTMKGQFSGKIAVKRYAATPAKPAVCVLTMTAEPKGKNKKDSLDGIRMYEDAWLRVQPVASPSAPDFFHPASSGSERPLTLVQSSRRFRLTFDAETSPSSRRHAGMLTDFLLEQLTQEVQLRHQTVETLLLQTRIQ